MGSFKFGMQFSFLFLFLLSLVSEMKEEGYEEMSDDMRVGDSGAS